MKLITSRRPCQGPATEMGLLSWSLGGVRKKREEKRPRYLLSSLSSFCSSLDIQRLIRFAGLSLRSRLASSAHPLRQSCRSCVVAKNTLVALRGIVRLASSFDKAKDKRVAEWAGVIWETCKLLWQSVQKQPDNDTAKSYT